MTKPWQQAAWKAKRNSILTERPACEICGRGNEQGKTLVLHQPLELEQTQRITVDQVVSRWFHAPEHAQLVVTLWQACQQEAQVQPVRRLACPMGHVHVRWELSRQTYVCYPCGAGQPFPVEVAEIEWVSPHEKARMSRQVYRRFKALHLTQALAEVKAHNTKASAFSSSLEGVQVLCKGCHLAIHQGKKLCPSCKRRFTKFATCFECLPEDEKARLRERQQARARAAWTAAQWEAEYPAYAEHQQWLDMVDRAYDGDAEAEAWLDEYAARQDALMKQEGC
jgi:uncharacterized Zn finger protein (UPF0148 family)